jgi:hypothetical protein
VPALEIRRCARTARLFTTGHSAACTMQDARCTVRVRAYSDIYIYIADIFYFHVQSSSLCESLKSATARRLLMFL